MGSGDPTYSFQSISSVVTALFQTSWWHLPVGNPPPSFRQELLSSLPSYERWHSLSGALLGIPRLLAVCFLTCGQMMALFSYCGQNDLIGTQVNSS